MGLIGFADGKDGIRPTNLSAAFHSCLGFVVQKCPERNEADSDGSNGDFEAERECQEAFSDS